MKKLLILAIGVVLLLAVAAWAQEPTGGKLSYGFKAGFGMATFSGSDAEPGAGVDKKYRTGFGGGGVLGFHLAPSISLQFEALYLMKGVKYQATTGDSMETIKLDYIEVPITLHVAPAMEGKVKPRVFAGPFFGFLLSAKDKAEGFADPADNGEVDVKDACKTIEFGLTIGAGVDFGMNKGAVTIDLRYDLGLSEIADSAGGPAPNWKNSGIFAMLGYRFDM